MSCPSYADINSSCYKPYCIKCSWWGFGDNECCRLEVDILLLKLLIGYYLVSAGYPVCTTIGHTSSMGIHLIGKFSTKTETIYYCFPVQERRILFALMVVFLLVWLLACWYYTIMWWVDLPYSLVIGFMKFPTIRGCAYVFTCDDFVQACWVSPRHSVFELCENITVSFCFLFWVGQYGRWKRSPRWCHC